MMGRFARFARFAPVLYAVSVLAAAALGAQQTEEDTYSRYELLDPASGAFRIAYDLTATSAGARRYWNGIRRGSEPVLHQVIDRASGAALAATIVTAAEARAHGYAEAEEGMRYVEVELARPVPAGGGARIRIDKTYRDAASYQAKGQELVFERALGVRNNAVVLPLGYELVGCSVPAQVATEGDGRLRVSVLERGPGPTPLRLVGRRVALAPAAGRSDGQVVARPDERIESASSARRGYEWPQRAREDREIVYFLQAPETHSFRLYHDYTEARAGVDRYLNLVRAGSRVADPSARDLDSGETLRVETLRGAAIAARGIETGEQIADDTEVVVVWFPAVAAGRSLRLRIEETYTDAGRYGLDGAELIWDRGFGRTRNTVVLPAGWALSGSAQPAVVDLDAEGRVRLQLDNDRPDEQKVLVRARRRAALAP